MRFRKRQRNAAANRLRYVFYMTIIPSTTEPEALEEVEPAHTCVLFDQYFDSHEDACEMALETFKREVATSVFLAEFRMYQVLPSGQYEPVKLLDPKRRLRAVLFTHDMFLMQ